MSCPPWTCRGPAAGTLRTCSVHITWTCSRQATGGGPGAHRAVLHAVSRESPSAARRAQIAKIGDTAAGNTPGGGGSRWNRGVTRGACRGETRHPRCLQRHGRTALSGFGAPLALGAPVVEGALFLQLEGLGLSSKIQALGWSMCRGRAPRFCPQTQAHSALCFGTPPLAQSALSPWWSNATKQFAASANASLHLII